MFYATGVQKWLAGNIREFKLEAVRLIRERGVSVTQAARDLDVGEGVCCVAGPGRFRRIRSIRFRARGR